jgi:hypothetical protein
VNRAVSTTASALAAVALLVACHGAGGPVLPASASGDARPFARSTPTPPPPTHAWGLLRSDPANSPLPSIPVKVYPWHPCHVVKNTTTLRCPKALVTTETDSTGRFAFTLPSRHYLLVIGSDSATDFTYATIHDSIELKGETQQLLAPDLPQIPCKTTLPATPAPGCYVKVPAVERSGDYRIVAIEKGKELPCLKGFDADRKAANLAPVVQDEWITENTRALGANWFYAINSGSAKHLTTFSSAEGGAGPCHVVFDGSFQKADVLYPFVTSPQMRWFAGYSYEFKLRGFENSFSVAEFPIDPRYNKPVSGAPPWP